MNDRARLSGLPWTAAQDEQLRALARANTATRDIADRMNRTPEAVFSRAHELGLTMKLSGAAPYSTR
jgi:hypothetical protein